jgi:hypothetical protein
MDGNEREGERERDETTEFCNDFLLLNAGGFITSAATHA